MAALSQSLKGHGAIPRDKAERFASSPPPGRTEAPPRQTPGVLARGVTRNPPCFDGVVPPNVLDYPKRPEVLMKADLTPTEARSGVISGRVITVLVVSLGGAILALGVLWLALAA